jgi:hypothetical protein
VTPLLLLAYGSILRRKVALRRATVVVGSLAVGLLSINLVTSGLMTAFNPDLLGALRGNLAGQALQFGSLAAILFLMLSTARTLRLLAFGTRRVPHRE